MIAPPRFARFKSVLRDAWARTALGVGLAVSAAGCDSPNDAASSQGSGTEAASAQTAVPIGTFATREPVEESEGASRLPAQGDRAIYVPATTLFPGAARIDPEIENPYAGDPDAIAAGERHFNAFNCSGCHAPWGGGGMGPPLSDDEWIYGGEPAQIYLSTMHGRPEGMPAWSSMLPQRTAWELVTYIESLRDVRDFEAASGFDGGAQQAGGGSDRGSTASPAQADSPQQ